MNFEKKTCYSIFGAKTSDITLYKLYFENKPVENVRCCKYLGILIDCDLKWQDHINHVYNKLIKFVSIFLKIRKKITTDSIAHDLLCFCTFLSFIWN